MCWRVLSKKETSEVLKRKASLRGKLDSSSRVVAALIQSCVSGEVDFKQENSPPKLSAAVAFVIFQ